MRSAPILHPEPADRLRRGDPAAVRRDVPVHRVARRDASARKQLGEATLGQIDTGSFMLKLALLGGVRGVAANVLWTRAIELQKLHEWDKLEQTVNMITKLQPHFLSVWTFQSWNLAYNVSVEWDDPADKYEWIKKGIKFVKDGVEKNQQVARPALGHRLVLLPQARLRRRGGHPPQAVPRRRGRGLQARPAGRTSASSSNDNFQLAHGWFTSVGQPGR